ncbi:MAG TPA: glycine zipper 2TM domain-containing protein [Caulobacteraceae bacterium]|nr:glycine zipper 2TM domain-containing protein [Caulobacteraceae bacterium]
MKTLSALTLSAALAFGTVAAIPSYADAATSTACKRSPGNKGTVVGGILGAVVGSQVAARGVRTEGAVLGGAVGAVAGHQIAKKNAKCRTYSSSNSQYRRR